MDATLLSVGFVLPRHRAIPSWSHQQNDAPYRRKSTAGMDVTMATAEAALAEQSGMLASNLQECEDIVEHDYRFYFYCKLAHLHTCTYTHTHTHAHCQCTVQDP